MSELLWFVIGFLVGSAVASVIAFVVTEEARACWESEYGDIYDESATGVSVSVCTVLVRICLTARLLHWKPSTQRRIKFYRKAFCNLPQCAYPALCVRS